MKRLIREGKLTATKFGNKWIMERDRLQVFTNTYDGSRGASQETAVTLPRRLNQSQGGMCICRTVGIGLGISQERLSPRLQHRPATPSHLILPVGQPGEEVPYSFLYCLSGSQAQVASGLLPRPASDGLVSVEVRTVARQVHQPQVKASRPQVFP